METENLEIVRGDDKFYNLTFTDSNGDPIDITGWTIFFTAKLRKNQTDSEGLQVNVSVHTDAVNGETQIHLPNTDTINLQPGNYYYDIQAKKDNGNIFTILMGKLKVYEHITIRTT
jgi:predicted metalloendopeptidase